MAIQRKAITRRQALTAAGVATAAIGVGSLTAACSKPETHWDHEADIVVVGSGIGASTAAVTVRDKGNSVILVEKAPIFGGTSARTAGVLWIPNNFTLKERNIKDTKEDCLKYLARFSYPEEYNADSENLGLSAHAYSLLESFYDNGSKAIDSLREAKALNIAEWRMFALDRPATDYLDHVPENKVPAGRALGIVTPDGTIGSGIDMMKQMEDAVQARTIPILLEHEATGLVQDENGRVIGLKCDNDGTTIMIKASKAVIFGTGGYVHNTSAVERYQSHHIYGACASSMATGDFINIAGAAGARMGNLSGAWRTQEVLEEALDNRYLAGGVFYPPGDSVLQVNKYGVRAVNETRNYNDRTVVHGQYDSSEAEYPNQLMFMIYDQRTAEAFGGAYPLPKDAKPESHVISGDTLEELTREIEKRLKSLSSQIGGVTLAANFSNQLTKTIGRFNEFARTGKDSDFKRGAAAYDSEWHGAFSPMQANTPWEKNPYPSVTMHPLRNVGPYYAIILGAGALDTNGGPVVNAQAQVLDVKGEPIPGLYGAGNCIASPSRDAYWGAGCPLGLSCTFGYIAANSADLIVK
ncbi:MAG: FAD-dependent oxidoreductase [Emcibacter sp.]|nr:FAD-dependent oxidoreductase [Emcibacter sp.]